LKIRGLLIRKEIFFRELNAFCKIKEINHQLDDVNDDVLFSIISILPQKNLPK